MEISSLIMPYWNLFTFLQVPTKFPSRHNLVDVTRPIIVGNQSLKGTARWTSGYNVGLKRLPSLFFHASELLSNPGRHTKSSASVDSDTQCRSQSGANDEDEDEHPVKRLSLNHSADHYPL